MSKISKHIPWVDPLPIGSYLEMVFNNKNYKIEPSLFVAGGGGTGNVGIIVTGYFEVLSDGTTAAFTDLIGKVIVGPVLRGGLGTGRLITGGTPIDNQIEYTSSLGEFNVDAGVAFTTGEIITVTYTQISIPTTDYFTVDADGVDFTISGLIGKTIVGPILRGGLGTGKVLFTGTPVDNQIKFSAIDGKLTTSADVPFFIGEELTIMFI